MRLQGKTALITGAARGIGLAFARAYLAEGAEVAIADINLAAAQAAADSLGPKAHAIALDVTRQDSIDAAFAEAVQKMGKLDILINNAALFSAAPIAEITRADHDKLFAVNVAGTLFCTQAAARHMIPRGTGTIINMASQAGRRGGGGGGGGSGGVSVLGGVERVVRCGVSAADWITAEAGDWWSGSGWEVSGWGRWYRR